MCIRDRKETEAQIRTLQELQGARGQLEDRTVYMNVLSLREGDSMSPLLSVPEMLRSGASCTVLHAQSLQNVSWEWRCHERFGQNLIQTLTAEHGCSYRVLYQRLVCFDGLRWERIGEVLPARSGHFSTCLEQGDLLVGCGVGKEVSGLSYYNDHDVLETGRLFDIQPVQLSPGQTQPDRQVPEAFKSKLCKWGGTVETVGPRLYFAGGYEHEPLVIYDTNTSEWTVPELTGCPLPNRYEHTVVRYNTQLIYFGGKPSEDETVWDCSVCVLDDQTKGLQASSCRGTPNAAPRAQVLCASPRAE
eukprot:TRINITY_DN9740_c0_g1_i1.p1 TRINITY_DN9740_c0_g1~~TRINITY_DN9740_c0_g1_i1.p1  ORF type:complete len:303 (+),score=50.80 TRINITY_DN9740_c0_g1_i1:119-1027(+)